MKSEFLLLALLLFAVQIHGSQVTVLEKKPVENLVLKNRSIISIMASTNIDFVVIDPLGRKTGYDPINKKSHEQIPESSYGYESISTPDEQLDGEPDDLIEYKEFTVMKSIAGRYKLQVFGLKTGPGRVSVNQSDFKGESNDRDTFEFEIQKGKILDYEFLHTIEALPFYDLRINVTRLTAQVGGAKSDGRRKIAIVGQILQLPAATFNLTSFFELRIGGISSYKKRIEISEFKITKGSNGKPVFRYDKHQDFMLKINSAGEFEIMTSEKELALIPNNKIGIINVNYDGHSGGTEINLKCGKDVCEKQ